MTCQHGCKCGGQTPQTEVDPVVLEALKAKLAEKGKEFVKMISVKTQVVAGTNYFFEVETKQGKAKATLFRKLDKTFELTNLE